MMRRHILSHHRIRPDRRTSTHGNRAQHLSTRTNCDIILNGRVPLRLSEHLTTQRHPVIQHHTITNLGGLPNDNPHAMVNKKPTTNLRTRVNLNTGQKPHELRQHPGWTPELPHP